MIAQGDVPFDLEHIGDPAALKNALNAVREADKLAATGGLHYAEAIALYMKAYALNPDNAELNAKIGLCHLNGGQRHKALSWFQDALSLSPAMPRIHFLTAMAYQLNAKWDEAIAEYEAHLQRTAGPGDPEPLYNTADQHIAECRVGKALMAEPVDVRVENLGPSINSDQADYGVLIAPDGGALYFTSRRPSVNGRINKATNAYFEDVYVCRADENGGWTKPSSLPPPVNSAINDAAVSLFDSGRSMVLYRDVNGSGDLFTLRRSREGWGAPEKLGPNIDTKSHESSAWPTADGHWLYFVSDRPDAGGQGGQDIYRSPWDPLANEWGPAEDLGPTINTPFDEDGIFVSPDGGTIYFSSKGHSGMGGFDIYRSQLINGRWTAPENMGWPINSPDDDLFFVLAPDGHTGYFSSLRAGGLGEDDLYRVTFPQDGKTAETMSAPVR
ncbi:MAG: PD40 domain-containing protein [Flavobacteriales bacterium]|nr:PD40 domain-containing protein [Flavobacteriales bacterium]MCB9167549.1 PD40 domain-containing protein [Flavobacteriales bacterium]